MPKSLAKSPKKALALAKNFNAFIDALKLKISTRRHYPRLRTMTQEQCIDKASIIFTTWLQHVAPSKTTDLTFYPPHEFSTTGNGVLAGHDSTKSGFLFTIKIMGMMLKAARGSGTELAARAVAGITKKTMQQLYREFPTFRERIDDAVQDAVDHAEGELYNRAVHGDGQFYDAHGAAISVYDASGNQIAPIKSDMLLKFYMQSVNAKYAAKAQLDVNVSQKNIKDVPDDVLLRIIEQDQNLLD